MTPAEARALLAATSVFAKDDADRLWEALLSLDDAAELVEHALRLDWQFHPRGFDNVDLHRRYGDGIVPWLASRLDGDGVLHNHPWCIVPCLLACASGEAFALAWRVRSVQGRTPWGGAGDRDLAMVWAARHPEVARVELAARAPTDARARAVQRALFGAGAGDVLALLDACAAGLFPTRVKLWPAADTPGVRLIAARAAGDWGLALERVDGTRPSGFMAARVSTLAFGSRVRGAIEGVAISTRPVPALAAADLDERLGPAALALPALGLPADAEIVAVVPHASVPSVPSASPLFASLAAALNSASRVM